MLFIWKKVDVNKKIKKLKKTKKKGSNIGSCPQVPVYDHGHDGTYSLKYIALVIDKTLDL